MKLIAMIFAAALVFPTTMTLASDISARPGWHVIPTNKDHATLAGDLSAAVKANGLIVVTRAGPTKAAARRGITIPDNLVVGVFNNDYAVRVLALSTAAMIEAPIRFYVTEKEDGTATLSYKTPGHVFSPYLDEGGEALAALADELDVRFREIAAAAAK